MVRRVRHDYELVNAIDQGPARDSDSISTGIEPAAGRQGRGDPRRTKIDIGAQVYPRRQADARKIRAPGPRFGARNPRDNDRERQRTARRSSVSHLLDVNFLIACAWQSHAEHVRASRWLRRARSFATSSISEMGFL